MRKSRKGIAAVMGAVAIIGAGTACGVSSTPALAATSHGTASPKATPTVKKDPLTTHYKGGLTVGVSDFKRGVSGAYDVPPSTDYVQFTVRVQNGSKQPRDMALFLTTCQVGGKDAEWIYDDSSGSGDTHVLPGKTYTYTGRCAMPKSARSVQVEVTPDDFSLSTSVFTAKVK